MQTEATKKLRMVRAALAHRGHTFASWADKNGYPMTTVWYAVRGLRHGKTARRIRAQLEELANA